jgi:hypothetical protein
MSNEENSNWRNWSEDDLADLVFSVTADPSHANVQRATNLLAWLVSQKQVRSADAQAESAKALSRFTKWLTIATVVLAIAQLVQVAVLVMTRR